MSKPKKNDMKIPDAIKRLYQDLGVTKLPEFLNPVYVVNIPVVPEWALGQLKVVELPAMAGDGITGFSPSAGHRWKLMYAYFKIVCDATVANRYFRLELWKGSDLLTSIGGNSTAITASQTKSVMLNQQSLDDAWYFGEVSGTFIGASNLQNYIIHDDWTFRITVNGGVAGDAVTGRITVLEIEEYGDIL